jgi:hypothetical protein
MFAVALLAGRSGQRSPSKIIRAGFLLLGRRRRPDPDRAARHSGWAMAVPLLIAGAGLGLLVSQLNNYTLVADRGGARQRGRGVNSAGGSFGLSFGLAFAGAIMLASLSLVFTHLADSSNVLSPTGSRQVATGLEKNAEVMTNTHLEELLAASRRRSGRDPPHQHEAPAESLQIRAARSRSSPRCSASSRASG